MFKKGFKTLGAAIAAALSGGGPPPAVTARPVPNHPPKLVRVQLFPEAPRVERESLSVSRPKNGTGRNQRKCRKARRRAWAAGNCKAFN